MRQDAAANGTGSERRSSCACCEGFEGRAFGAPGRGAVRHRDLDGDPLDRAGQHGGTGAAAQGRRRGSSLDAHEAFIVGLIEGRRDITLHEMAARLLTEHAVAIRRSALSAWLRGRGWTFKKTPPMHWSRSAPMS